MAIDARRSDIFGLAEQFLAAIGANDVAEDSPEIADFGILRNLDWWAHGRLCCTCEGAGSRAVLAHSYAPARLLSPMSCLPPPPGRPPARPACSSTSRSAPMRRRRSRARRRITCSMSRSEEHTSELQSLMRISYAVFCLKKKNIPQNMNNQNQYK